MKEKIDDYLDLDFYDLTPSFPLNRREFLKLFGGGIIIVFSVGDSLAVQEARRQGFRPRLPEDFNAFLRIGEDGRVTCFTGKVELGQGVITSLAQMLADELDVPLASVDMTMGDTDLCPWDMGTFGSMTTRFFGPPLRAAAAKAKSVLIELASEHLNIPSDELKAKAGYIFHPQKSQKRVSYSQLTKGKRIVQKSKGEATLKTPADFFVVGTPVSRTDAGEKVTGEAKFAGDIRLPGMLYARILRPPAHRAELKSLDLSAAEKVKGIKIIQDQDLIAVLHEKPDMAEKALDQVRSQYEKPESEVDDKTIFDHLLKVAPKGEIVSEGGQIPQGVKLASLSLEKTYLNSYVAHTPVETHTALAKIESSKATIWASTQTPFRLKEDAAEALGFPPENVRVITPFVGGGFGGKTSNRQGVEAAKLAKAAGRPVQVAWTRAEEFFFDTFRPAAVVKIRAGTALDKITFWDYGVYFAGERGSQHFYNIPHHRTIAYGSGWRGTPGSHPFGTGAWRAPANNTNTFARESHISLMASHAGIDPLEFRLTNLKDKKMRRVLRAAADKFGWISAKSPSGRGYGISLGIDAGTYVAHIAEVEVDKVRGDIQVKRVVCAQDMGLCINPEGTKMQMEGCITMGLGYALKEEIHFNGGEIFDLNFDTYEIPRFSWLPEIETIVIDDKASPPQGGGEPAIIGMGAVIANAVYDATGASLLQLPMTPERVKMALEKS